MSFELNAPYTYSVVKGTFEVGSFVVMNIGRIQLTIAITAVDPPELSQAGRQAFHGVVYNNTGGMVTHYVDGWFSTLALSYGRQGALTISQA